MGLRTFFQAKLFQCGVKVPRALPTAQAFVTDRGRAQARFPGLLEAPPDAMVCMDRAGQIALVNAQAERFLGCDGTELAR